ncbi:MAG TPA: hypothetical protein DCK93_01850 [Blastocatellia bacterium]|nr:hypothetical protein [Blastocatellia bacterium]
MTTKSALSQHFSISQASLLRIGIFIAFAALVIFPLFTVSSASFYQRASAGKPVDLAANSVLSTNASRLSFDSARSAIAPFALMPQATPTPSIATFESTCVTPDSEFNLGQEVCATATNTGGSAANRRISWVDPSGFIRQVTPIAADPQDDHFTIPTTPTSTLSNGQVVNNIGNWRVNIISSRSSLVASTGFVVKDPANATADLSVTKRAPSNSEQVAAGSNGSFDIFVQNSGPDDAATVTLTDHVPNNTTFVAMIQTSGPGFTCTTVPDGLGNITCTIDTLATGASATFDFVYTVNTGTAAGTLIINTASIASATTNELNNADNSATATASVASGGNTGTCTLTCPDDIVTAANTTDGNNNPGAVVHFTPTSSEGTCGTVTTDHCNDCFFPLGTTVVTTSATTGDSCSFTVTVTETGSNVTISCPANQTADADSTCTATVTVGTATGTGDNVTISAVRSDGKPMYDCDVNGTNCTRRSTDDPFSAGVTTITWTAYSHDTPGPYQSVADEESHRTGSASCTQTVTVNDVTPPLITAVDQTVSADANCQAAVPDYTNSVTDNCSCAASDNSQDCIGQHRITVTQDVPAGSLLGPGAYPIHLTANDGSSNNGGAGNTTTKDITFTVKDTTPPTIQCPANITTSTDPGLCSAVVNPGTATATDNCDTNPTVAGTRSDGQPLNATYPKGTTTITWTATDHASPANQSSCTQTVTVQDHENPTISCPANITLEPTCPSGAIATYTAPVGTDNCPGAITTRTAGGASGSVFPIGTTTVTYTVTDASGNSASCSFTVTVKTPQAVIQNLINSVSASSLSGTQKNGLLAKLNAALDALNKGQTNVACNKLSDFVNSVGTLISHGDISAAQGNAWINSANHVINTLGCTNNPCT